METGQNGKGFTLIEMALVTVVIGILAMLLIPIIAQVSKLGKISEGKEALLSIKDDIIGYAMVNGSLPNKTSAAGNPNDKWGRPFRYFREQAITVGEAGYERICAVNSSDLTDSINLMTTAGPVNGTAFLVSSNGPDGVSGYVPSAPPPNRNFTANMSIVDVGDDLIEYVSLNQLKTLIGCGGVAGQGAPIGSQISFENNIGDFGAALTSGAAGDGITVDTTELSLKLKKSSSSTAETGSCMWYDGTQTQGADCADGVCTFTKRITAYMNFESNTTRTGLNDGGFTFAVIGNDGTNYAPCGAPGAQPMSYSDSGANPYIQPPKTGFEVDLSPNTFTRNDPNYRHYGIVYWGDSVTTTDDNKHDEVDSGGNGGDNPTRGTDAPGNESSPAVYKYAPANWFTNKESFHVRFLLLKSGTQLNATSWITNSTDSEVIMAMRDFYKDFSCPADSDDCWKVTNSTNFSPGYAATYGNIKFGFTMGVGGSGEMGIELKDFGIRFDDE